MRLIIKLMDSDSSTHRWDLQELEEDQFICEFMDDEEENLPEYHKNATK